MKTKSRKDKLGAITVRKFSGPDNNAAYRTAKEFERRAGGTGDIAEKFEALGDGLPKPMRILAKALRAAPKTGLVKILATEQASLIQAMKWYARGAVELAQIDAAIEMHRNLPPVVKDIARHALDQEGVCQQCLGTGTQRQKSTDSKETQECKLCQGAGMLLVSSPHKEWAAKAILNATGVEKQKAGSEINVAVGINVAGGKSYSERVIDMADRLLHGQEAGDDKAGDVIEAEVVEEA